jgi:hypothetical protein
LSEWYLKHLKKSGYTHFNNNFVPELKTQPSR